MGNPLECGQVRPFAYDRVNPVTQNANANANASLLLTAPSCLAH
jgi:hypothetical protein